jgi:hypothetical protein
MAEKLKIEIVILLCALCAGGICSELVSAAVLPPGVLYGGIFGIAFSLFALSVFISISVRKSPINITEDDRVLYGFLSLIALMALMLLVVFELQPVAFWVTAGVIYYFSCVLRLVILWN